MYSGIFENNKTPKEELLFAYRILFQLINLPDIYQSLDNDEFWRRCVSYFRSEAAGKIGNHLKDLVPKLDFTNENIFYISKLLDDNNKKITPSVYSKLCGTTGFVAFFIKDCLEYMGITDDKKAAPQRLYKNAMFKFDNLQKKSEHLKNIIENKE